MKPFKNTNSPKSKAKQLQTKAASFKAVGNKAKTSSTKIASAVKSKATPAKKGGFFKRFLG